MPSMIPPKKPLKGKIRIVIHNFIHIIPKGWG